ncbi:MAG TPA: nucleotidyl transferase AbiEii/AbiGii toxin family protein [Steroidobacteraceae bacterium]|jgi:predicted nucleotidyltransferase component of viral defense system
MLITYNMNAVVMWAEREAIEVFHLLFLRAFGARADRALYALKGGCNLRFFHKSIRYSEDVDLDVRKMSVAVLRNHVDRVLSAPPFLQTLRAQQIEILKVSSPKQTETTQRWKLTLRSGSGDLGIPTKIEFSRRAFDLAVAHEPVDPQLTAHYRLYPVLVQHYTAGAAFCQKVLALAFRTQTQARDLFDLKLLIDAGAAALGEAERIRSQIPQAIENAMTISYDDFAGQVLAYLEPSYQDHYRTRKVWDEMQEQVVNALQGMRS